jgi:hypothetical protein
LICALLVVVVVELLVENEMTHLAAVAVVVVF